MANLKYGQVHKLYRSFKYRDNKRKKLIGHVFLIGAARLSSDEYFDMVNYYGIWTHQIPPVFFLNRKRYRLSCLNYLRKTVLPQTI